LGPIENNVGARRESSKGYMDGKKSNSSKDYKLCRMIR